MKYKIDLKSFKNIKLPRNIKSLNFSPYINKGAKFFTKYKTEIGWGLKGAAIPSALLVFDRIRVKKKIAKAEVQGYAKGFADSEEKYRKLAEEFINKKSVFTSEMKQYEELIAYYEQYIAEIEKVCREKDSENKYLKEQQQFLIKLKSLPVISE